VVRAAVVRFVGSEHWDCTGRFGNRSALRQAHLMVPSSEVVARDRA
jgi:hypothetical protein